MCRRTTRVEARPDVEDLAGQALGILLPLFVGWVTGRIQERRRARRNGGLAAARRGERVEDEER